MKYAVIRTGGKQYKVSEGQVLEVERLVATDQKVTFDQVLMVNTDGDIQLGQPLVAGFTINAIVLEDFRGEKIRVAKFKAKARHRRVIGHRQELTRLKIEAFGTPEKKASVKKEDKSKSEPKIAESK